MGMKKVVVFLILFVVFIVGCIGGIININMKIVLMSVGSLGINFKSYVFGKVFVSWYEFFNEIFYVSNGYEDFVKYYFLNVSVKFFFEYFGSGILVLLLQDVYLKKIFFGKLVQVQKFDFFGYIVYRNGMYYIGFWYGVVVIFNFKEGNFVMVVFGMSRVGVGVVLNFFVGVKLGKVQFDRMVVVCLGNFEGMFVKEMGDMNFDGIVGEDEFVIFYQIIFDEFFQYYWCVVKGENIIVSGGFIRMVNDIKVYICVFGFNVSVRVKNNKGIIFIYVIDNINFNYVMVVSDQEDVMKEVIFGGMKVVVVFFGDFLIIFVNVSNYIVLVFGDYRLGSGEKQLEVFFKIRDVINKENGVFVIDSGDFVYLGMIYQWEEFMKVWKWNKLVFVVVGNYEYNGESVNIYYYYFGLIDYVFSFGGYCYIFVNNVMNGYRFIDEQWVWLEKEFERVKECGERLVIVMYVLFYDLRLSDEYIFDFFDVKKFFEFMREYNVFGIFGYIYVYWYGIYEGVLFVIIGGGGVLFYVKLEEGGFYYYVCLFMRDDGFIEVEFVEVFF